MINDQCFTQEWQARKRQELGGCDPVLLEKTIHAFALLDALAARGVDFVFKGGTSLLLRLPRIRRLSIDADILCLEPAGKLDPLLDEIGRTSPFVQMSEDARGEHRIPARRHFKFFYKPLDPNNPAPFVLLDVVHERNIYPKVELVPLRTAFVESDGALRVPTREGLLGECLSQYFKTDTANPVRKNLEFFIPLRNRIEHRSMAELDSNIFGECQAMLLNFDEILAKEFGEEYCLRECLSFSLQLFPSSESLAAAVMHHPDHKSVVEFIQQYRSTISPDITATGKYCFKAFLIQVANHKTDSALPIQFVHYDRLSEEDKQHVLQFGAMVKFREIPVSNLDTMRAGDVVKRVQAALGNPKLERDGKAVDKFNVSIHTRCWRHYKARPPSGSSTPQETNPRFCVYDKRHDDYGYTQAWVDFLIDKLRDDAELDAVCRGDQAIAAASQLTSTATPNAATAATPTPMTIS